MQVITHYMFDDVMFAPNFTLIAGATATMQFDDSDAAQAFADNTQTDFGVSVDGTSVLLSTEVGFYVDATPSNGSSIGVLIIIIILAALALLGYYMYKKPCDLKEISTSEDSKCKRQAFLQVIILP